MVSRFIRVARTNIVDEPEGREIQEHYDTWQPGKLQDVETNFPNSIVDNPDWADQVAPDRVREGERGVDLNDLTESQPDEANQLTPYSEWANSYPDSNDYEDFDLHLGYLRPGDTPGESLVIVVPVPEPMASEFPAEADGQEHRAHITVLYLGKVDESKFDELESIVDQVTTGFPALHVKFKKGVEYFTNKEGQRIAHKGIEASGLEELHNSLRSALSEAGFEIKHYPSFIPHATLAYGPEGDEGFEYPGPVPEGQWTCDALEIWGTGEETPEAELQPLQLAASLHTANRELTPQEAEQELRKLVGGNFDYVMAGRKLNKYRWTFEQNYPVNRVESSIPDYAVPGWSHSLKTDDFVPPIFLLEFSTFTSLIDGNHRVAGAKSIGRKTLPAIVGRPMAKVNAQMTNGGWLAVDLDNTILSEHDLENRTPAGQPGFGEPLPGAIEALATLQDLGYKISIYTARFGDDNIDLEAIKNEIAEHLDSRDVPYDDIWTGRKPRCKFYIDDRAIHFDGDWPKVLKEIVDQSKVAKTAGGGCPVCGGPKVSGCRCRRGDSKCAAGHEWHKGDDGTIHQGPSTHGGGSCCPGLPPKQQGVELPA